MADLGDVLDGALVDVGEAPGSTRALIGAVGDREAVRVLAGMSGPPRRAAFDDPNEYRAANTRWRSASRRVQRAREVKPKGGQQTRAGAGRLTPDQRDRWKSTAEDRRLSRFVSAGARIRITARVRTSTPDPRKPNETRTRTMPAGGPGVFVPPEEMDAVIGAAERGDDAEAQGRLLDAFADGYGVDPGLFEFEEIVSVSVWPENTREPG